jgi:uncharacterized membrane protein
MNRKLHKYFIIAICLLIPLIVFVSTNMKEAMKIPPYYNQIFEEGRVLKVLSESLEEDPVVPGIRVGRQEVIVEVLTGPYAGEVQTVVNTIDQGHNVITYAKQKLILGIRETNDGPNVWIYNYKRSNTLLILVGLFIMVLLYFGGKKGFNALIGLLFTGTLIIFVLIPLIYKGFNPVVLGTLIASLTIVVSFILIGGFEKKSYIAIIGTVLGVITAGILAYVFGELTKLSALNIENGILMS